MILNLLGGTRGSQKKKDDNQQSNAANPQANQQGSDAANVVQTSTNNQAQQQIATPADNQQASAQATNPNDAVPARPPFAVQNEAASQTPQPVAQEPIKRPEEHEFKPANPFAGQLQANPASQTPGTQATPVPADHPQLDEATINSKWEEVEEAVNRPGSTSSDVSQEGGEQLVAFLREEMKLDQPALLSVMLSLQPALDEAMATEVARTFTVDELELMKAKAERENYDDAKLSIMYEVLYEAKTGNKLMDFLEDLFATIKDFFAAYRDQLKKTLDETQSMQPDQRSQKLNQLLHTL